MIIPDTGMVRFVILLLFLASPELMAVTYSSGLAESRWQLSSSIFECQLSHDIQAFGSASFVKRAGDKEVFRLRQELPLMAPGKILLQTAPPAWRPDAPPRTLRQLEVQEGPEILRLDDGLVRQLQEGLAGRLRLVVSQLQKDSSSALRVLLEPQGFVEPYEGYKKCVQQLLPVNFQQVERTSIYFPADGEMPKQGELRKLDNLIRYVKADKRVKQIFIDGHTDSEGLRPDNLEVSKQRAELIANYLIERGIAESQLVTRWHGERYPVATNQTAAGRAQNRRVTLRLDRGN